MGGSLVGRLTSCEAERGRWQDGWAMAWSREQAGTQWGPEWPLQTVTRAGPRARGDLHRKSGLEEISECHAVPPGHRKGNGDWGTSSMAVRAANTNPPGGPSSACPRGWACRLGFARAARPPPRPRSCPILSLMLVLPPPPPLPSGCAPPARGWRSCPEGPSNVH